jgi:hypothetical protein
VAVPSKLNVIYDCYVKTNSYTSFRRKFRRKFPDTACPSEDTSSKILKKVRTHGILIENRVLTEQKLDEILENLCDN